MWTAASIPSRDIETINLELVMADLETVQRRVEKATKAMKGDKKFAHEVELFDGPAQAPGRGQAAPAPSSAPRRTRRCWLPLILLTLKPVIYAANIGEEDFAAQARQRLPQAGAGAGRGRGQRRCWSSAPSWSRTSPSWSREEKQMFLEELGIAESGLDRLIKCSATPCWA